MDPDPQDPPLQAMRWEGKTYIDPMLPFGLRSAPKIFNALADALNWHLQQAGIPLIRHYLDDYIIISHPDIATCKQFITILHNECSRLGIPIAAHKSEGPTTCLTFLGIEIDTLSGQLRLPDDKLQRLKVLLHDWEGRKHCEQKQLESPVGLFNHACKGVQFGRSFLRRMIHLLHALHHPPHSKILIRLNKGFRSDLAWWSAFIQHWNGISFLHPPPPTHLPKIELYSDASGSWGCGARCGNSWFQLSWDAASHHLSIAEKELIPITLASTACGASLGLLPFVSEISEESCTLHLLGPKVFCNNNLIYTTQFWEGGGWTIPFGGPSACDPPTYHQGGPSCLVPQNRGC